MVTSLSDLLRAYRDERAVRPRYGTGVGITRYYSEEYLAGFDACLELMEPVLRCIEDIAYHEDDCDNSLGHAKSAQEALAQLEAKVKAKGEL